MNSITIEDKEYVVLPKKVYEKLILKAAAKATPVRKLTLDQGKKHAYKLINKWAKGK